MASRARRASAESWIDSEYGRQYAAAARIFDHVPEMWRWADPAGYDKEAFLQAADEWLDCRVQCVGKVAIDLFDRGCMRQ